MSRTYTLRKRAEQQAETRRRIVEAAVELHTTVGPARTTISMVAERAGVQRHTFYAHFPDDRSLLFACSGLVAERDPLPDPEPWRSLADQDERLRVGLRAIYDYFERNAELTASVLRDAEYHPLTREISEFRTAQHTADYSEVLGDTLSERQRALLRLALSFYTWRTLTQDASLDQDSAVGVMVRAISCAK